MSDFRKCICECPGFCSLFKQNMEDSPPNWQWCQHASEQEREEYYRSCRKREKHNNTLSEIIKKQNLVHDITMSIEGEVISTEKFLDDTMTLLIPKILQNHKIAGVLGVPRSGMLNASAIANYLSVPLYGLEANKIIKLSSFSRNGGRRMGHLKDNSGQLIIIDDTIYGGGAAYAIKNRFPDHILAVTYATPEHAYLADYYGRIIPAPHFLEWNLFNSGYLPNAAVDIDGIFCPNVPLDICRDETRYIDYLINVVPYFKRIAKLFPIKALVTARLEKYRSITEDWLHKYGIKYENLIMLPNEMQEAKHKNHLETAGRFKAEVAESIGAKYFIESELIEGKKIKEYYSSIIMVCPNHGVFF